MNPLEIEKDIRNLEIMLYGGAPLRPSADFGRGEVGHFESAKARDPVVHIPARKKNINSKEMVVERRVLTKKGEIIVTGPKQT